MHYRVVAAVGGQDLTLLGLIHILELFLRRFYWSLASGLLTALFGFRFGDKKAIFSHLERVFS